MNDEDKKKRNEHRLLVFIWFGIIVFDLLAAYGIYKLAIFLMRLWHGN